MSVHVHVECNGEQITNEFVMRIKRVMKSELGVNRTLNALLHSCPGVCDVLPTSSLSPTI